MLNSLFLFPSTRKKNPYISNNALQREHLAFLSFKFLYYISIYLSLCVHSGEEAATHSLSVEGGDNLEDSVLSFKLGGQGSNLGHQAWWQVTLPAKPSC